MYKDARGGGARLVAAWYVYTYGEMDTSRGDSTAELYE